MKRLLLAALFLLIGISSYATHLTVEYSGVSIPKKYIQRIERTLVKELDFYGPLGLGDSVKISVHVFRNNDDSREFLLKNAPTYVGGRASGMFFTQTQTAYIFNTENLDSACQTVVHEISHFFLHKTVSKGLPACMNEGLAEYFGCLNVKKDGSCVSQPDPGAIGALKTAMMLGEFDFQKYLFMKQSEFNDISRHDAGLPYSVCHIIMATMFDNIGSDGVREIVRIFRDERKFGKAIDDVYPGGRKKLENDVYKFVAKQ